MKLFRTLSVYALTSFINASVSFAGFSVMTHYLTEVDLGIINLYTSFTIFLGPFIAVGTPFLLNVDFFKMDAGSFRNQFTNALSLPVITFLIFTPFFIILCPFIKDVLKLNLFFTATLPFACFMIVMNEIMLNLFRNKEQTGLFVGYSIGKILLEVALSLVLIVGLGYGWQGRLGSSVIVLFMSLLFALVFIRNWHLLKGSWNRKATVALLVAGLPFIPERLGIFVLGYSDRYFIDHYRGTAAVGLYSVGTQVAAIVTLAIVTFNIVFYPGIYKALSQSPADYKNLGRTVFTFIGLSLLTAAAVGVCIPIIFRYFIGAHFQAGKEYALFLTVGSAFWAIYNAFLPFLLYLKKNRLIMYISLLGMVCSLAGNFFAVRYFGAIGATYTNMIVYFLMALITMTVVHKHFNLRKLLL
jgi:O-antigen/teichoic acid export membrane protein